MKNYLEEVGRSQRVASPGSLSKQKVLGLWYCKDITQEILYPVEII